MLNGTGDDGRCGAVSWDSRSYANISAAGLPGSIITEHDPFIYSQPNMQTTIHGLDNAISNLQQGQLNIQQEHASMHTRQESITGTLEQICSALTEIRDGRHISLPDQNSQSSTRKGVPCHPHLTVIQPGTLGQ